MSKPNVIVRVEKTGKMKGSIYGVFDADTRNGKLETFNLDDGFVEIDPEFYRNNTRPARADEEQFFTSIYETKFENVELKKRRSAR